jgi:NADPH oxidase
VETTVQPSWLAKQFTLRKIIFYTLFHGLHIFLFIFGWYKQASDDRLAPLNTLKFSVWFSRGAGLCLSVDTMIILLPMCRNLVRYIRPKIRWLPLDESKWFHRQVAYTMLFWTVVHVAAHYVNFFNVERSLVRAEAAVQIHYMQAGGITGHVMLLCMLLMFTTAHAKIRQQSYETFWYTHHLFIPFLLAMYTHATGCFVRDSTDPYSPFAGKNFWGHCIGYQGWRWELVGGIIYLFERLYREIRSRRQTEIIKVVRHPYGMRFCRMDKRIVTDSATQMP